MHFQYTLLLFFVVVSDVLSQDLELENVNYLSLINIFYIKINNIEYVFSPPKNHKICNLSLKSEILSPIVKISYFELYTSF
jgi:hypothetical protein